MGARKQVQLEEKWQEKKGGKSGAQEKQNKALAKGGKSGQRKGRVAQ